MRTDLEDHGLPLVALREQRRELILSLVGHKGAVTKALLAEISVVQTAIAACEAVIQDLDQEVKEINRAA